VGGKKPGKRAVRAGGVSSAEGTRRGPGSYRAPAELHPRLLPGGRKDGAECDGRS